MAMLFQPRKHSCADLDPLSVRPAGIECCLAEKPAFRWILEQPLYPVESMEPICEFSLRLAHRLKNPLAAISGSLQVLGEGARQEPSQIMTDILAQVDRVGWVMDDLLHLVSPGIVKNHPLRVANVVENVLYLSKPLLKEKKITVHRCLGDEAPKIEGDGPLLQKALLGLVNNAVEAMNAHGELAFHLWWPQKRSRCGGKKGYCARTPGGNDSLKLMVLDSGCGMDAELLEKAAVPLFSTRDNVPGMGLAIAQRIIEQHGGSMFVGSRPKVGTMFLVNLPLRRRERGS